MIPNKIHSINIQGRLYSLEDPKIMGILNLTPDSFYDGGQFDSVSASIRQVEVMIQEGADMIDIGSMSSRPYRLEIPIEEELRRLQNIFPVLRKEFPKTIFSIDTYRSGIAEYTLSQGANMINDISGGRKDAQMLDIIAKYKVPYVLMHMLDRPETMQENPSYNNILIEIATFFQTQLDMCISKNIHDIILDIGFGFGKSLEDNYHLLKHLGYFSMLNYPILVGLSRKSMIQKVLNCDASQGLNGTTALHWEALRNGAKILRVHDVKEAKEVVKLFAEYNKS
jgi:dihydropteroate synthase